MANYNKKGATSLCNPSKGGCQTQPEIERSVMDGQISTKGKQSRETGGKFVFLLFAGVVRIAISKLHKEIYANNIKNRYNYLEIPRPAPFAIPP